MLRDFTWGNTPEEMRFAIATHNIAASIRDCTVRLDTATCAEIRQIWPETTIPPTETP